MSFFCWRPSCFFMTFRKFPMAQNCRTFVMLFSPLNCTRNDHKTFCCNFLRIGGILTGLIRARPVCLCCCGSVRRRTAMLIVDCDLLTIDRISSAQECVFIYCTLLFLLTSVRVCYTCTAEYPCPAPLFSCRKGKRCVHEKQVLDGVVNCLEDDADEGLGTFSVTKCNWINIRYIVIQWRH